VCTCCVQARREAAVWDQLQEREQAMLAALEGDIVAGVPMEVTSYDFMLFPSCSCMAAW
jgi:hypothetical protein